MNSRGSKNRRFILSLVTGSLLTLLAAIPSGSGRAQTDEEGAQGYVLGSGDILKITVLDELELSGSFQVSSVGKISYPFLGMLSVAGMTVEELDQLLVR